MNTLENPASIIKKILEQGSVKWCFKTQYLPDCVSASDRPIVTSIYYLPTHIGLVCMIVMYSLIATFWWLWKKVSRSFLSVGDRYFILAGV